MAFHFYTERPLYIFLKISYGVHKIVSTGKNFNMKAIYFELKTSKRNKIRGSMRNYFYKALEVLNEDYQQNSPLFEDHSFILLGHY